MTVDARAGRSPVELRATAPGLEDKRVLIAGHTYVLRVNQQKIEALSLKCGELGLLVPSNWRDGGGLYGGQSLAPQGGRGSFRVFHARALLSGRIAGYFFEPAGLARALARFRPHLVHIDQEVYSLAAAETAVAAKASGARVCVFGWENLDRELHPAQALARKCTLSLADAVVSGNTEGTALVRRWGFRGPVETIPQLGVDPAFFALRRAAPRPRFTVGFLGRLVPEKAVDVLLEAAAELASGELPFQLKICGEGPQRAKLREMAVRLNLAGRTVWTGPVEHERVPEVMRDMDVLVLPSRAVPRWKEQFGHVLIEAMSMGIATVGSSSGAIPEVIGRDDLIFEEDDASGLARILRRLMTDPGWKNEVERQGRSRVLRLYTHERVADRLVGLWGRILRDET